MAPKVKQMDATSTLDLGILKQCFEQGFMGVEIPSHYGGNEMSFTSSIIVIEELAKIDPSLSVVVDVQVGSPQLNYQIC